MCSGEKKTGYVPELPRKGLRNGMRRRRCNPRPPLEYVQVHGDKGRLRWGKPGSHVALRLSSPTACPSVCRSSTPTEIHLHFVHAGWRPDTPMGRGRGRICLIAAAPTHCGRLPLGLQWWSRRCPGSRSRYGSGPAHAHPVPALTVSPVTHETVPPHELLGADAAFVWLEARVCLHVLRQMVLHLELFVAHGAVKGSQVEMHIHVPVPHALM